MGWALGLHSVQRRGGLGLKGLESDLQSLTLYGSGVQDLGFRAQGSPSMFLFEPYTLGLLLRNLH